MKSVPEETKPKTANSSYRGPIIAAWIVFLIYGSMIMWSPLWQICFPIAVIPVFLALMSVKRLISKFRTDRKAVSRSIWWVGASVIIFVLHVPIAGNWLWLRHGVELRLLRAGGIHGLESWVSSVVAARQAQWDGFGGNEGYNKLDHDARTRFYKVMPEELPERLKPLVRYMGWPHLIQGNTGRPIGLWLNAGGGDFGWWLNVYQDPPPAGVLRSWPYRLSDRSDLHGKN